MCKIYAPMIVIVNFSLRDVFIISAASGIAVCRMKLFSGPQKQQQQLHHHIGEVGGQQGACCYACVWVHLKLHSHQQLLQYAALLPRATG
jgi:hypothetical protein